MSRLVVATGNRGKIVEIDAQLEGLGYSVVGLFDLENPPEIVEDADTFAGNAIKKATVTSDAFGCPALADDSGLCVDALDGKPGVYTARYGGPGLSDTERYQHLLAEMGDVPEGERGAAFHCAIAYAAPNEEPKVFHGVLQGHIALSPAGDAGFGYDPVFIPDGTTLTMAQLGMTRKKQISHRAQALDAFIKWIKQEPNE